MPRCSSAQRYSSFQHNSQKRTASSKNEQQSAFLVKSVVRSSLTGKGVMPCSFVITFPNPPQGMSPCPNSVFGCQSNTLRRTSSAIGSFPLGRRSLFPKALNAPQFILFSLPKTVVFHFPSAACGCFISKQRFTPLYDTLFMTAHRLICAS